MASIINASNTSGLTFTSDMSGVLQLQQNGVALPALSVAPAFSAYASASQNIVTATFVKLQMNTEEFDTANCYDTTNYRFTPNVAGYYFFTGQVGFNAYIAAPQCALFKNGSQFKDGDNPSNGVWATVSALIYMNGTTDYVEFYGAHTQGTTQATGTGPVNNYFQGFLARGA